MAKIVVLATGGTIAGKAESADAVAYKTAQIKIDDLLGQFTALDEVLQDDTLETEQIAQIDSKNMDFDVWQKLLHRCAFWLAQSDVCGVVITHGTDTLEETAFFLKQALVYSPEAHKWQNKAVVLTCAMRPTSARMPDGAQNFADACSVIRDPKASGVLVVCAGVVHSALAVQKIHPFRLDAFSSGDAGNLGWVEPNRVRWLRELPAWEQNNTSLEVRSRRWHTLLHTLPDKFPWVEIIQSCAGTNSRTIKALVDAGVQGIVISGTGNATYHESLTSAIQAAHKQGVELVLTTRCYAGAVVRDMNKVNSAQDELSLAYSNSSKITVLSPVKARIQMLLNLLLQ